MCLDLTGSVSTLIGLCVFEYGVNEIADMRFVGYQMPYVDDYFCVRDEGKATAKMRGDMTDK